MIKLLLQGTFTTLQISLVALVFGILGGLILGVLNCNRYQIPGVKTIIHTFVSVVRGTPLFVQILIIYFGLSQSLHIDLSPFFSGVLALAINSSAYVSETVRGGINSIPQNQWEASSALGYTPKQTLMGIILPQMFSNVLPALTNEVTTLIKETSILMIIGVSELTKAGRDIVSRELNPTEIYLIVATIYFCITSIVSIVSYRIEKRLRT